MSAASDRLPRLLALVPYFLARPGIRLDDAAAELGVPAAQLRRDLELLWVCGLPGYGPGDLIDLAWGEDDTITITHAAGINRPLRLTADEALALVVALRALRDVPGFAPGDVLERSLAKLESAAGEQAAGSATVAVRVEAGEATMATVRRAVDEDRALWLRYYTAGRDETTERVVDPSRLLLVEGHGYLEAWCRRAEDVRLFRLDRIDDLRLLDEPSRPPAGMRPRDVRGGVFRSSPDHLLITVRLAPAARWVPDFYPCESVAEQPDGQLLVGLRAASLDWARRLVMTLGPAARVVDPPELAAQIRAEAARALAAYAAR